MMKKVKKGPAEPSPSTYNYQVGEDARQRFRYQSLLQDYDDLLKETEAKKKKLQKTKGKKLKLLAEVKFLRRKYKSLSDNPSQIIQHKLMKQYYRIPTPSIHIAQTSNLLVPCQAPSKQKNLRAIETAKPSTSALLDLNKISLLNGEEMDLQSEWEPLKTDKLNRRPPNGGTTSDLKLSICRDVGNNSNTVGKRRISWQDQVVLRV